MLKNFYFKISISAQKIWEYLYANITDLNVTIQFLFVAFVLILSLIIRRILIKILKKNKEIQKSTFLFSFDFIKSVLLPLVLSVILLLTKNLFQMLQYPASIIQIALSLSGFWILIMITTFFIGDLILKKTVLIIGMLLAILGSLGVLTETITLLDTLAISFTGVRISAYTILKALILLIVLGWLAKRSSLFLEHRLHSSKQVKPSLRVLLLKITKVLLFTIIFFIVLSSLGINLTAFALFTGAIGIGVGLGLQKVVSNLISGMILLLDDSIKPGDVIEISDNFGWVKKMGARYIAVIAIDGKEYLIPNEDLITTKVINWSHSDDLIRLDIDLGVSYQENVHKIIELLLEIPKKFERILKDPEPQCFLTEFGSSSIDFKLVFWIRDPRKGVLDIKSHVLTAIWDCFKDNDISIPYPQRDLHIKYKNSPGWNPE